MFTMNSKDTLAGRTTNSYWENWSGASEVPEKKKKM